MPASRESHQRRLRGSHPAAPRRHEAVLGSAELAIAVLVLPCKKDEARTMSRVCEFCGKEFKPKAKNRIRFCSRDCSFANMRAGGHHRRHPDKVDIHIWYKTCPVCNLRFATRKQNRVHCSDECRLMRPSVRYRAYRVSPAYQADLKRAVEQYWSGRRQPKCGICDAPIERGKRLCHACLVAQDKVRKAAENGMARARKAQSPSVRRVSRVDVMKAYGTRCHICGETIDLAFYLTINPAPQTWDAQHRAY